MTIKKLKPVLFIIFISFLASVAHADTEPKCPRDVINNEEKVPDSPETVRKNCEELRRLNVSSCRVRIKDEWSDYKKAMKAIDCVRQADETYRQCVG